MPSVSSSLSSLVSSTVPEARHDERLRRELVEHCQEILNSHIGHSREPDIGHLADQVKRLLLQSPGASSSSMKFVNLLSRLLEQPALSRKHATLQLLYTLASSPPRYAPVAPSFLPSLAPPPSTSRPPSSLPSPADPLSRQPKKKTKAEVLNEYRIQRGRFHVAESALVRDVLYLLQGISGKYVRFADRGISNTPDHRQLLFVDDSTRVIPSPVRTLLLRLAEIGHLYTLILTFVREREGKVGVGMIEQSLCHYIQTQLTEYYRLVAVLETQLAQSPVSNSSHDEAELLDAVDTREAQTGLTLRRLEVWTDEWRLRMRMMSVCVEGCREAHGGALVNLIHGYTDNGDPFIRNFTDELLEEVSKPFFGSLHSWLFSGELHDPYSEFFVALNPDLAHLQYLHPSGLPGAVDQLSGDGGFAGLSLDNEEGPSATGGLRLWESKYMFQKEMLPAFVGDAFGRKIFSTGKSLNFIRYTCHDSDWVATREKLNTSGGTLKYSDIAGLERSIDIAYRIASQRLFDIFFQKFRLLDHLKALKQYLMLGQGDFADQLMETLGPSLGRPANTLYRHNLTATLETAIRSSNAQSDRPDVLRRLDARMLEYSHGEIGWDVFTLEYKVDAPIDTVLDPSSMVKYQKVFNHLWKMKRIESTLGKEWMRLAGGARTFLKFPGLTHEWHQIRLVIAEMIHFIRQLQAYCHLEIIECQWKILMDFVKKKEGDLDALIDAHRTYLDRTTSKVLLHSPKTGKEEALLLQVREIFLIILQFCESVDNLYNYCLAESARRDTERDAERGLYTTPDDRSVQRANNEPGRVLQRINQFSTSFSDQIQTIVHGLQTHSDFDCRFLGIRLSFSDFYRTRKEPPPQSLAQTQLALKH